MSWDDFPNDKPLPPLVQYDIQKTTGEIITINPMNISKHTPKDSWVHDPALYYSLGNIIDEPDTEEESISKNPRAIENGQSGKSMVYSKSNVLDKLKIPSLSGQVIKNDVVEVVVHYNEKTGSNYTLHYDVKINTQ